MAGTSQPHTQSLAPASVVHLLLTPPTSSRKLSISFSTVCLGGGGEGINLLFRNSEDVEVEN